MDTGASRSIFPPAPNKGRKQKDLGFRLVAANGSPIATYGWETFPIRLQNKTYTWKFLIADVKIPLLGADFLGHYNLLVDVANRRLINTSSFESLRLTPSRKNTPIAAIQPEPFKHLYQEFPEVFKPELRQTPGVPSKHGIYHYITTNGPPVFSRYRRLPPEKLKVAKKTFQEMEDLGICQKAASPWASPLHMVTKTDSTWRPCSNYR